MKPCPYCKKKPKYDKDMKVYYCKTEGCQIKNICMQKEDWGYERD
jgi:hypothetical protein